MFTHIMLVYIMHVHVYVLSGVVGSIYMYAYLITFTK